jgi:phage terminase Nu1 subunit (DNA packaging protein)
MPEYVTQTTFGRRIGVTHAAIYNAVRSGRIDIVETSKGMRLDWITEFPKFVRSTSNPTIRKKFKNMKEYSGLRMKRNSKHLNISKTKNEKQGNGKIVEQELRNVFTMKIEEMDTGDILELTTAIKAKKAQLEYEKELGKKIDLDEVLIAQEEIATAVKSAVLSIPDRVCSEMVGMNAHEMHRLLTEELNHALTSLASGLRNE